MYNIFSYIWAIIKNIIVLFIIFLIFNQAYSSFETIVFCFLILIYISISQFFSSNAYAQMTQTLLLTERIINLKKLFNKSENENSLNPDYIENNEVDFEKEEIKEAKDRMKPHVVKFYINSVFNFVIFVVCIFYLFGEL
ncbi:hypothetical protein GYA54_02960 [Candidatus Kuenenbacteria bacterium]|nr:hypothetical protein [Candidatus Kuenenbacteria bacterium]